MSLFCLALALAACGTDSQSPPATQPQAPAPLQTDLSVTTAAPNSQTRRIRCPGDALCARLERVRPRDLEPVKGGACTAQYGGDWTAQVQGKLHGRPIDVRFGLENGCEIARWQRFAWLLGASLPQAITGVG